MIVVDVCAPLPSVPYDSATPEDLAETVSLVEKIGRRVISGMVDVRDLDKLREIVDDAVRNWAGLDVIVANAGICVPEPWDQVTPQIYQDTISTNITGTWNTVMAGAPHLVAAGGGSVILISSAAGIKVQPFMVPYTTSKFAVRGMAKAFAAELGQHNIRVNSVHPTGVNTPMGSGEHAGRDRRGNRRLTTGWARCSSTCCRWNRPSPRTSRTPSCSSPRTNRSSLPHTRSRRTPASRSSEMASTRTWFETVAEAQRRARRQLPKGVYLALVAGAEAGVTMNDNVAAFSELRLRPHVADLPATRDLATTVMGQEVSLPVLISPTGVQAVHPDGEVAVARAAAAAGTAMGLSSFASKPVEEVGKAIDKLLFQSYWVGSREDILARAERARAAGAKGLIVTLDWVFDSRRDWGSPWIPEKLDLQGDAAVRAPGGAQARVPGALDPQRRPARPRRA